jgi:hypothetical protein
MTTGDSQFGDFRTTEAFAPERRLGGIDGWEPDVAFLRG